MVRLALPSKIAHEHQKSDSSTVRWGSFFFFSEPSPIRPRTKNYSFSLEFRLRSGHGQKTINFKRILHRKSNLFPSPRRLRSSRGRLTIDFERIPNIIVSLRVAMKKKNKNENETKTNRWFPKALAKGSPIAPSAPNLYFRPPAGGMILVMTVLFNDIFMQN